MFLRRVTYNEGPPPGVGWWLTRVNRVSAPSMRWWNGKCWSIGLPADSSAITIAERNVHARQPAAHPQRAVRWSQFKPQWWVIATSSRKKVVS